jgi:hypothetical protein
MNTYILPRISDEKNEPFCPSILQPRLALFRLSCAPFGDAVIRYYLLRQSQPACPPNSTNAIEPYRDSILENRMHWDSSTEAFQRRHLENFLLVAQIRHESYCRSFGCPAWGNTSQEGGVFLPRRQILSRLFYCHRHLQTQKPSIPEEEDCQILLLTDRSPENSTWNESIAAPQIFTCFTCKLW